MFDYEVDGQISLFDGEKEQIEIAKKIRLIELFAGYGSQAMAFKRLGVPIEHHFVCEFDKYAIKSYNAVHGTNYDVCDIRDIHNTDLNITDTDKYCYFLTYSFPCCPKGTKVKTLDGYKNIEDISVGDTVNTHTNEYHKVVKKMHRVSNDYYTVKALGLSDFKITGNHPVYVLRDDKKQWVDVKDLKLTDMVCFNVNEKCEETMCDDDILWLLGRYAADGHINKYTYNSVNFSIGNHKEKEFLDHVPSCMKGKFRRFQKTCADYRIADSDFQDLCCEIGIGSTNKKVPQWILDLKPEKAKCFLDGYISGDGHIRCDRDKNITMFTTVSHELFLGIQQLIMKCHGVVCSCYIRKDKRKESFNDTYNGQFSKNQVNAKRIGNQIFTKIREIKKFCEQIEVFNMEVEKDNSYVCENIVVHNCTDLSVAGKQAGMSKGSGTRSGLLWEVERLLQEIIDNNGELPQILFMENVPQVHGKKNIDDFNTWIAFLDSIGYVSTWKDLNAKDYGVPQNRNRTFMFSFLKSEFGENPKYEFPKPIELDRVLKDVLEDEVEEKYYINNERADKLINDLIEREVLPS